MGGWSKLGVRMRFLVTLVVVDMVGTNTAGLAEFDST